jgi:nicotinic acid mononucleotide adenylyltransferase
MTKFVTFTIFLSFVLPAYADGLRVALYGGTFGPPTPGHEHVVDLALAELNLDVLYVLPNVKTEHKPGAQPYDTRLLWTKIVFSNRPKVIVAPDFLVQPYREKNLDAVFVAYMEHHKNDQIFLILGDDSYIRNVEQRNLNLGPNSHVAVVEREFPGKTYPPAFNGMPITLLGRSDEPWSSTQFRSMVEAGEKPRGLNQRVWELMRGLAPPFQDASCNREFTVPTPRSGKLFPRKKRPHPYQRTSLERCIGICRSTYS